MAEPVRIAGVETDSITKRSIINEKRYINYQIYFNFKRSFKLQLTIGNSPSAEIDVNYINKRRNTISSRMSVSAGKRND